jgi:hypothetical protein
VKEQLILIGKSQVSRLRGTVESDGLQASKGYFYKGKTTMTITIQGSGEKEYLGGAISRS